MEAGMVPLPSSCWHSPDELVFLSPVSDGEAVKALNVSLDFGGDHDPRGTWSQLWEHLHPLEFESYSDGDGAPLSIDDQISRTLAFEIWSGRRRARPQAL
jgi:hypothetical protein